MNANYQNLKRGLTISNGDNFGTIDEVLFDMVLINWQGINPPPTPPIFYPADVWDFRFGSNYTICEEAQNENN